jgi:hypothetical protein
MFEQMSVSKVSIDICSEWRWKVNSNPRLGSTSFYLSVPEDLMFSARPQPRYGYGMGLFQYEPQGASEGRTELASRLQLLQSRIASLQLEHT